MTHQPVSVVGSTSAAETDENAVCSEGVSFQSSQFTTEMKPDYVLALYRRYNLVVKTFGFDQQLKRYIAERFNQDRCVESVLDAGCGTGNAGICLARLYPEAKVLFTDINCSLLEQVRRQTANNPRVRVGLADISRPGAVSLLGESELEIGAESFDVICAGANIGYSSNVERTLIDLYKMLKPGGVILDMEMNQGLIGRLVSRLYRYPQVHFTTACSALESEGAKLSRHKVSLRYFPANLTRLCIMIEKPAA